MPSRNTIEPTAKEVIRDNKKYLFALAILVLLLIMTALLIVAAKDSNIGSNSAVVDRELKTDLNAVAYSNKGLGPQRSERIKEGYDNWDELPDVIAPSFDYKQIDTDIPVPPNTQEEF